MFISRKLIAELGSCKRQLEAAQERIAELGRANEELEKELQSQQRKLRACAELLQDFRSAACIEALSARGEFGDGYYFSDTPDGELLRKYAPDFDMATSVCISLEGGVLSEVWVTCNLPYYGYGSKYARVW